MDGCRGNASRGIRSFNFVRVNGTVAKVPAEEHRDHVKPLAGLYGKTLIVAGSLRILTFEKAR